MSDIVERLRRVAKTKTPVVSYGFPLLEDEAADEIERLRAGLQRIIDGGEAWSVSVAFDTLHPGERESDE